MTESERTSGQEQSHKLAVAKFLPDIQLATPNGEALVPLRPSIARTTILVSMHSAACAGCRGYIESLAPSAAEFHVWDARLIIVAPEPPAAAAKFRPPFGNLLADADHQVACPGDAVVIAADRYGHIFDACHCGAGHAFPAPRQLEEWLKFLGTLCPE